MFSLLEFIETKTLIKSEENVAPVFRIYWHFCWSWTVLLRFMPSGNTYIACCNTWKFLKYLQNAVVRALCNGSMLASMRYLQRFYFLHRNRWKENSWRYFGIYTLFNAWFTRKTRFMLLLYLWKLSIIYRYCSHMHSVPITAIFEFEPLIIEKRIGEDIYEINLYISVHTVTCTFFHLII